MGESWKARPEAAEARASGEPARRASGQADHGRTSAIIWVERAIRRKRWSTGLAAALRVLPWALALAAVLLLFSRWTGLWAVGAVLGALLVFAVVAWALRAASAVGPLAVALELDRALGRQGQLVAAFDWTTARGAGDAASFGFLLSARMAPLDAAAVDGAMPWRLSPPFWGLGVTLLLFAASTASLPTTPPAPSPSATSSAAPARAWLLGDDAELLKERGRELAASMRSESGRSFAARYNEIVLQAASGALTQQQAFRLAAQLESELAEEAAQATALAEGLKRRGSALAKFSSAREVGSALEEGRFRDADQALRKLAERLQQEDAGLSREELDDLRKSIAEMRDEAAAAERASAEESASRRSDLERRVRELEAKQGAGKASEEEKRELERGRRELKRLNRQKKASTSGPQQELSELDRQLAEAAKQLAQEREKSGEFLEQAAQSVGEVAARQLTDEEKRDLIRQLQELKERLRQQKSEGEQAERMRRFQQRARGQRGEAQARPGEQARPQLTLGPGGQPLPIPGQEPGGRSSGESGGEEAGQPAEGSTSSASPGQGHDPNVAGDSARLAGTELVDSAAVGQDTGAGPSASETIRSAAEEGFSAASYERLFVEYETVAEEKMQQMEIPAGRRSQVMRYFELIRPREVESQSPR